jgi:hypothetical protein
MSDTFATLVTRARDWFERAHADGWLTQLELERFLSLEHRTPRDLFADARQRPLVVAFFGGTGVGKSSLLNRLAGEPIARTGVERPTSREVTIYVHESVELAKLPPDLPIDQVHIQRHRADARRDVLWIDAPDIDSTARENRRLALAWLPHVDLLIYVVSPERYRDDVGWRVLRQRGERHGWMFVLNRWDEGDARQRADFARMLHAAGFDDPLLLCTSCLAGDAATAATLPTPDEFDRIEATIREHLAAHGVRELERLGHRARLLDMRSTLHAARQRFGDDEQWKQVDVCCQRHWQRTRQALVDGLEWPIRATAARFAVRAGGLLGQVVRQAVVAARSGAGQTAAGGGTAQAEAGGSTAPRDAGGCDAVALAQPLWDSWAQDQLAECLDAVELELRRAGIAVMPARKRLDGLGGQAGPVVLHSVQERLRAALARPGTRLQRAARRVTGFLMTVLPMLALLWVAFNVVRGYYRASSAAGTYLGTDFAVSSVLLVIVAWAVPFVFDRMLRPSLERTALLALRRGLADGLDRFGQQLRDEIAEVAQTAQAGRNDADIIARDISKLALQPLDAGKASLSRLLATPARHSGATGTAGRDRADSRAG